MSLSLDFRNNIFSLNKLQLPSRYYYFKEPENYIKFLTVGEGLFPKDRVKTEISLENSSAIFSTESATKIYSSKKEFAVNQIQIELVNSNFEFLNDELILFSDAKFLQFLKVKSDANSTFFYGDILSRGRSFENFDFEVLGTKNSFFLDGKLEYLEKYTKSGDEVKEYLKRHNSETLFAKVYIRTSRNIDFLNLLKGSFSFSKNRKMILGVYSGNMVELKKWLHNIWRLYREFHGKTNFNLGKQ
jgi:urease accessory protein